jgi:hypothetical protein
MQTARASGLILLVVVVPIAPAASQSKSRSTPNNRIPSVAEIKDYPATGLTSGCPNYYFFLPQRAGRTSAGYVFLAREKGVDAWMNLDGRDTRLKLLKAERPRKVGAETEERYSYQAGATEIRVQLKYSDSERYEEFPLKLLITLRRGLLIRRVRAIGFVDC